MIHIRDRNLEKNLARNNYHYKLRDNSVYSAKNSPDTWHFLPNEEKEKLALYSRRGMGNIILLGIPITEDINSLAERLREDIDEIELLFAPKRILTPSSKIIIPLVTALGATGGIMTGLGAFGLSSLYCLDKSAKGDSSNAEKIQTQLHKDYSATTGKEALKYLLSH